MERSSNSGMQDTGNPVLDSVVNIISSAGRSDAERIREVHKVILGLAGKEPNGLKRRGRAGLLVAADVEASEYESEAPKAAK